MDICVQKVTLENFISWEVSHEFQLGDAGLVYLLGPNGSGKSSIFDAITWALFGRTTKALLADDVVNNRVGKDCRVSLEFKSDKNTYCIDRYRNHHDRNNETWLSCNNAKPEKLHGHDTRLRHLIGMDYDKFIQTIFFSQGDRRYFTQLGEVSQREVLASLFDFDKFREAQARVRESSRELMVQIHEFSGEYNYRRGLSDDSRTRLRSLKAKLKASIASLSIDREAILANRTECEEKAKVYQENIALIDIDLTHREVMELQIEEIESNLKSVKAKIEKLRSVKICPTCKQEIKGTVEKDFLKTLLKEKENVTKELLETEQEYKDLPDPIKTKRQKVKLQADLRLVKIELNNCEVQLSVIAHDLGQLKDQIYDEREKLKKKKITEAEALTDLRKARRTMQYYEFWEEGFGGKGIELFALSKVLPIFNKTVNGYLGRIPTRKGPICVNYHLERNHLSSGIRYVGGSSTYAGSSGGEKRRIDLSVSMALNQLSSVRSNIIMLDEPFESIESSAFGDVVNLLRNLPSDNIFVCSHNPELKAHFTKIWEIGIDEQGGSQILKISKRSKEVL